MMNIRKLSLFCFALLVTLANSLSIDTSVTYAQAFQRIFSGGWIEDLSWSADGATLSFFEGDSKLVSTVVQTWYEYDPSTETLTPTAEWPRQPSLSSTEVDLYRPAVETETINGTPTDLDSFVFSSPDDEYIVFASETGANRRGYPVLIAERASQTIAETYTLSWRPSIGLEGLNVVWNQTSSAFVVSATPSGGAGNGPTVQAHVDNFTTTLTDLVVTPLDALTVNGDEYRANEIYSISDDGNSVLLRVVDLDASLAANGFIFRLLLWDATTNSSELVGDFDGDRVRAAVFDDGDANNILLLNESGVIRYTVSTDTTTILNSQITSDWVMLAAFSNDGQRLAVTRREGGMAVYVFDLTTDFTGLKVRYYPESTTRTEVSEIIEGQFNIINTSNYAIDLNELTIRYFFSRDSSQTLQAVCSWTALPNECDDVTATAGAWTNPISGADSYLEIGFTDGTLAANSETQDIIVRVNKQDWSDFFQGDDYSFDATSVSDTFVDWTLIALYYNGELVWGTEPY